MYTLTREIEERVDTKRSGIMTYQAFQEVLVSGILSLSLSLSLTLTPIGGPGLG